MVQPSLTGLDFQKLLSWYGFHEEHGLRNCPEIPSLRRSADELPVLLSTDNQN